MAYDWNNYCMACAQCNRRWKKAFLVVEPQHTADDPPRRGRLEKIFFIHPYEDKTHLHLEVESTGCVLGLTKKGRETIAVVGLNRPSLIESRADAFREAKALALVERGKTRLQDQLKPSRTFLLARYWGLRSGLDERFPT